MLKCKATDTDDPTVDPRFGKVGKQTIEDTGPLTKKRMETIDDETSAAAIDYMKRQKAGRQAVLLLVQRRRACTCARTCSAENRGKYTARRQRVHRRHDRARRPRSARCSRPSTTWASPTTRIVVYTTDNGPHMNTWPDGAMTPFRSEKNTNWEGAFRVPCLVRWPGKIKPGTVTNELMSHNDWIPTLCAIAGEPDIVGKCKKGYTANGTPTRSTSTATTSRRSCAP